MPSGVSYMLANREVMKRVFPALFDALQRAARSPTTGRRCWRRCARSRRRAATDPTIVVLTPGVGNSAYFEHAFLAREMGIPLVEGRDLLVHDNIVYMRTTAGLRRVDVIYRRVDDDFLDPLAFRPDSHLGVAGLLNAYRAGNVVARQRDRHRRRRRQGDLRLRAGDHPVLPGRRADPRRTSRPTCSSKPADRQLRARASRRAGGEGGRRVGRLRHADRPAQHGGRARDVPRTRSSPTRATSSRSRRCRCRARPASSTTASSRGTSTCGRTCSTATRVTIVPGGLTRVALRKGSLVVNSSQGGGSKDTWVLQD